MPNNSRRQRRNPNQGPWWVIVLLLALELTRLSNTLLAVIAG